MAGFERCILLLGDSLSSVQDGIAGTNRSLALSLARYPGIKVAATVFTREADIPPADMNPMVDSNITVITPSDNAGTLEELYQKVNNEPEMVFPTLADKVPHATHIVGHSPITAEAAIKLKETTYPRAKVILFYHVIPYELEWIGDDMAYKIPTDTDQIDLAERADVVYSVSEKIHWFYTAKFRNRAQKEIDHRLFLPLTSADVFDIKRTESTPSQAKILILCSGSPSEGNWEGMDIALCAVNKVAQAREDGVPYPQIVIGYANEERASDISCTVSDIVTEDQLQASVQFHDYTTPEDYFKDLADCSLCIIPSRSEPYGYRGLFALSSGIPTLLAEGSALAPLIRRLTNEPEQFLVPITPTSSAYRQDASVWRDRILNIFKHPKSAHKRAQQLQMAIRRDNPTKETHDNIICYILGGVHLVHKAAFVTLLYQKDEDKELQILRDFNSYLSRIMQQCWRLKHHPLSQKDDLYEVVPGVPVPTEQLIKQVTDHIEQRDRRIVGFEEESGAFIVYCPTPDALSDLWAMCDHINDKLIDTLMPGEESMVLAKFSVKDADVKTEISGPEFLKYKDELMSHLK